MTRPPNRIKELRERAGLSLAKLAERCTPESNASHIAKIEKGQVTLSLDWMYRLAAALEVAPSDILDTGAHVACAESSPAATDAVAEITARSSSTRPIDLLSKSLVAEARELRINLSQACEQGVKQAIKEARASRWLKENRKALESSNAYVDAHGLPLGRLRQF